MRKTSLLFCTFLFIICSEVSASAAEEVCVEKLKSPDPLKFLSKRDAQVHFSLLYSQIRIMPDSQLDHELQSWAERWLHANGYFPGLVGDPHEPQSWSSLQHESIRNPNLLLSVYSNIASVLITKSVLFDLIGQNDVNGLSRFVSSCADLYDGLLIHEFVRRQLNSKVSSIHPMMRQAFDNTEHSFLKGYLRP